MPGCFITFEGGEGAGKSTQVRLLAEALHDKGIPVVTTREPGGSAGAEEIRTLLVEGPPGRWDGLSEALLHYAARRDHVQNTVLPALADGRWVISDRFNDSTIAYQGYGHGTDLEYLRALYRMVAGDLRPHLTIILDLPADVGLRRAGRRGGAEDRYERMAPEFHARLREGFLAIAAGEPDRCVVIDAAQPPERVHEDVLAALTERLSDRLSRDAS